MNDSGAALVIGRVRAMAYHAREGGKKTGSINFLVKLGARAADGSDVIGVGEAQPRLGATGDTADVSWRFLEACLKRLHDRRITVADPPGAVAMVTEAMAEFRALAGSYSDRVAWTDPFRGTLLGIEMALLDVAARALNVPLAEMLGVRRTKVAASAPSIGWKDEPDEVARLLADRADAFEITRLHGTDGVEKNIALLESVAAVNASPEVGATDRALWIDLGGRFDHAGAAELLDGIAASIGAGRLPREILLEHPVPARERYLLSVLQRKADKVAAASGKDGASVRIVADQGSWNPKSMGRRAKLITRLGPLARVPRPRAAFIKPAQVGGLLGCIELAEAIHAADADARIYLGAMPGATAITAGALRNLAMAMPHLDAVADNALAAEEIVTAPAEPGVGARESYEEIMGDTTESLAIPEQPVATYDGKAPNVYPSVTYLQPLGSNGTKGHLLEREALMLGLSTTRYNKGSFVAGDGEHAALSFKWSRSPLSSAVSLALCTHKEATRMRLARAGVPVPKGNTFAADDLAGARAFVRRIGYPVVVKPAMGVRGIGVAANIRDDEALERAFEQLAASTLGGGDFIVEQHVDGRDYRIVVIGDEVIGAILREPGSVTGDGERSIAELVIAKNVARRANPHLWGRPMKYDDAARFKLERAGLTLDSVPAAGEKVLLSGSCSLSQGGDSIDVLDELHPTIKAACVQAVHAVPGLAFCGVDFLLEDHTKPLAEQQAGICELNAHAAIGNCEYPLYGTPRAVARTLMAQCAKQFDLNVSEPRQTLALHLVIRGRVTGVGYRAWVYRHARQFGLTGWICNVGPRRVEVVAVGDAEPASALAALAVLGPKAAVPTDVTTTHIEPPTGLRAFEIATQLPEEYRNAG